MKLLKNQQQVAKSHFDKTIFLEGVPGTGKTTAAIERIKQLIKSGVPAESILVIVPQSPLAVPYKDALKRSRTEGGANVQTATLGSLALRMVELFWPLIADEVGFANPNDDPHFLTLELVQYYMTRFIEPMIRRNDYFNSVHMNHNRIYTQIVDNLNKSAVVGFPHESIAERLKSAWAGANEQNFIYDDVQACAILFRDICHQHNLLDFSLQVDLFAKHLWTKDQPHQYLTQQYRHLIVDNLEEDRPVMHDLLKQWIKECDSALLIYDSEGGYRRFLGADPDNAYDLKQHCDVHIALTDSRVMSDDLEAFQIEVGHSLKPVTSNGKVKGDVKDAIAYTDHRYLPQMIDWTVDHIASLINDEGVPPNEIVILSAFLPDALRFSLQTRLDEKGIPSRTHRPSRALRDEPAARTLITLAKLAHPHWKNAPNRFDVAFALTSSINDLDLVRARLLTDALFQNGKLLPFDQLQDIKLQNRITFELGLRYEELRRWLDAYQQEPLPLDTFFSKLFGEVMSQPNFGFHGNYDAANTTANLIDSARGFRQTVSKIEPGLDIGDEYIRMVDAGVIANLYLPMDAHDSGSVLISPAYAFLTSNTPVDYQFWLNIGSPGWGQRLHQPLTQPYVLSRQWPEGAVWSDADEIEVNQDTVYELVSGLIRRCRKRIYLGLSQYGEQGFDQRGALLIGVQSMLKRLSKGSSDV